MPSSPDIQGGNRGVLSSVVRESNTAINMNVLFPRAMYVKFVPYINREVMIETGQLSQSTVPPTRHVRV